MAVGKSLVRSIGGFRALPDYSVEDLPKDYAGLVLIGGTSWRGEEELQKIESSKDTGEDKYFLKLPVY